MGKRSNFKRKKHDAYFTPYKAASKLFNHILLPGTARGHVANFIEPCAGDGRLIRHLKSAGHECLYACDINPQAEGIEKKDVLFFGAPLPECDFIITNPPWDRKPLHHMIEKFRNHADTWLLLDADWMHTKQARPYLKYCQKIVSVGRVSWEGNGKAGMDNCCWYWFRKVACETIFVNN